MKAKYINPFLAASLNLFQDYLGVACKPGQPYLNTDPGNLLEVSGIIGLAGETVGSVVVSFARETAVGMASRMAGRSYPALTNEVIDVVGEFVNIIAGNAKRDLTDFRIVISLPGVIIGQATRIKWPDGVPVITIPFDSDLGSFTVNVSLKS